MSKIDKKLVNVDAFVEILKVAGGDFKGLSHYVKRNDTYYWYKIRDQRTIKIGDVNILEQYLDKKFGKGTFADAFLVVMGGNAIGKMKNRIEELENELNEVKKLIKSTKNKELIADLTNILGE